MQSGIILTENASKAASIKKKRALDVYLSHPRNLENYSWKQEFSLYWRIKVVIPIISFPAW